MLYHVLEELPEVAYFDPIGVTFTTDWLVRTSMLAELRMDYLHTEGVREQVQSQEHSLELGKSKHVEPIECEIAQNESSQLFSQ